MNKRQRQKNFKKRMAKMWMGIDIGDPLGDMSGMTTFNNTITKPLTLKTLKNALKMLEKEEMDRQFYTRRILGEYTMSMRHAHLPIMNITS